METFVYENPANLVEVFENSVGSYGGNPLLGIRGDSGQYVWTTYSDAGKRVDDVRGGLAALGVERGDSVGIIGKNSLPWLVGAYASYGLGAKWVPMYEAELESVWRYIVQDAAIKVLFVASEEVYEKVSGWQQKISTLKHVIRTYGSGEDSLESLEKKGRKEPVRAIHPAHNEVASLIYTSGTTGDPKGVLLTHGNITSNMMAGARRIGDLEPSSRSLSILPWAHAYAQTAELHAFIQSGGSIGLARDVTTVVEDIMLVKPTHLIAVPRVFNKMYNGIHAKVDEQGGIAKFLFDLGVKNAARKREMAGQGQSSFLVNGIVKIADKVVFRKIRDKFGGRLHVALTASATMNEEIAYFFYDIGIPVLDCYGLTETSPAVSMNSVSTIKFGTVGKPIDNVIVKVDTSLGDPARGEGEVIVYGPNIMVGYHNKPEATAQVLTEDGGFRTGDIGLLNEEGYLVITGRIKEQYKLANGKYVFPAGIEEAIKLLPEVANVLIFGDGKDYNICLLVPDFEMLGGWIKKHGLPSDPSELAKSDKLQTYLTNKALDQLRGKYGSYEMPKKFLFLAEDFTVDNGMLTQTLKLKRRMVLDHYGDQINKLYTR